MEHLRTALFISFMVLSSLAYATLSDCPSCAHNVPNWTASAIDFLEGKPVNDTPSGLNGPQQARLIDAQIDSKKKSDQTSNEESNPGVSPTFNSTSALNVVLNNISASPNPSNLDDPVKITAVFGNDSIEATPNNFSKITNSSSMTVYTDIKNAAGIEVGRASLKQTFGNEYTGIWYANVGPGTYNATVDASGPQGSKIFDNVLLLVVKESKNATSNIYAIRELG